MATLTSEQLKDSYQSLLTIGDSIVPNPTSGQLENGLGNPITNLTVAGDITIADKIIHSGDTNTAIRFPSADTVTIETAGTEAMRIDSSGNVGIGTTSPDRALHVNGSVRINDGYSLSMGAGAEQRILAGGTSNSTYLTFSQWTGASFTERMRIDSSGNVLVGKQTTDLATVGHQLNSDGAALHTRSGNTVMFLNRTTSDGTIAAFRKDNTTVGSIGTISDDIAIFSTTAGHTGLRFASGAIIPTDNAGSATDDEADLGSISLRFDDVYATNGTIQTSDRNEKQDIEELNDAELRVAQKAKTLLRKFRWKSSVAENENARIHFGIIAQDLEQAFTDEGLDAGRYGMFIKSTWTNEEGEEQTRLGVRYNQLLAFIISAL